MELMKQRNRASVVELAYTEVLEASPIKDAGSTPAASTKGFERFSPCYT